MHFLLQPMLMDLNLENIFPTPTGHPFDTYIVKSYTITKLDGVGQEVQKFGQWTGSEIGGGIELLYLRLMLKVIKGFTDQKSTGLQELFNIPETRNPNMDGDPI